MENCKQYLENHGRLATFLNFMIETKMINPAQADYIVKNIILDEAFEKKIPLPNANQMLTLNWSDYENIEGYFKRK